MNTKFLKIAKMFTKAIQDELFYDTINDSLILGQLLRTEEEVENYINNASNIYFQQIAKERKGNPELIIIEYPELLNYVDITFTSLTAPHGRKNIYKLLNSGSADAIDSGFIPRLLTNDPYFRNKKVIAFDDNVIYYYPPVSGPTLLRIYYLLLPLQNDVNNYCFN